MKNKEEIYEKALSLLEDNNTTEIERVLARSPLSKFVYRKIAEIENDMKSNPDYSQRIEVHSIAVEYLLTIKFLREEGLKRIKSMNLSRFVQEVREKIFTGEVRDTIHKFLEPMRDAIFVFRKYHVATEKLLKQDITEEQKDFFERNGISSQLFTPEDIEILNRHGINASGDATIVQDVINTIVNKFKSLQLEAETMQDKDEALHIYKGIRSAFTDILIAVSNETSIDLKPIKEIGKREKLISNDILIGASPITPDFTHPLIDTNMFLSKFEKGTLTQEEERYLMQEDFVKRAIQYLQEGNTEKFQIYLAKTNKKELAKVICNMYKKQELTYEEFAFAITAEGFIIEDKNVVEKLKKEIKNTINGEEEEPWEHRGFTNYEVFDLARLGYVSDIDLIKIFTKQQTSQYIKYDTLELYENLLPEQNDSLKDKRIFITSEDMIQHFDAQRLLFHYFKPKNQNLVEILMFYKEYIKESMEGSKAKFKEFENDLLTNEKVDGFVVVDLFMNGFISFSTMKKMIERDVELKEYFIKVISDVKDELFEKGAPESNQQFIVLILMKELITPQELANIIGAEELKKYIKNTVSANYAKHYVYRLKELDTLGFLRGYDVSKISGRIEDPSFDIENMTDEQVIQAYSVGIISNEGFIRLKNENKEIQEALAQYIKAQYSKDEQMEAQKLGIDTISYLISNNVIDEFELIDILGDENFEQLIKNGLNTKIISMKALSKISFVDSEYIMELYNHNIWQRNKDENSELVDLQYLLEIYGLNTNIITIEQIDSIIKQGQDPDFKNQNFTNLSNYICQIIRNSSSFSIEKIKQLYSRNYLIFEDLSKLLKDGIITPEQALEINSSFCNSEKVQEIRDLDISYLATLPYELSYQTQERPPRAKPKHLEQTSLMIQMLSQMGYTPKIEEDISGNETIPAFAYDKLKNYRIFLSEENPEAVVLLHCHKIEQSNEYYQGKETTTYIVPTSNFYSYLNSGNMKMGLSAEDLIMQSSTITAEIGKTWQQDIQSGIQQVSNMLQDANIVEHETSGTIEVILEEYFDNKKGVQQGEE